MDSLIELMLYCFPYVQIAIANRISCRVAANRNALVEAARTSGATHILFMDADTVAPKEAAMQLLAYEKDVICATTCKRSEAETDPIGIPMDEENRVTNKKLIQMKFVGLPFMLINLKVFDKLQKPYFAEPDDGKGDLIPEDTYFCNKLREAGFEIWCDMEMSVKIKHIGTKEYQIKSVDAETATSKLKVA